MEHPLQRPPVERDYMRLVVGRKGKPARPGENEPTLQKHSKRKTGRQQRPADDDYLVELTTFHVRQRWRSGWQ